MRDILSKLDAIISETELRDQEDLQAKRKALQDLQMDPVASQDPQIKQAIMQRKAELEKEAKTKGFSESFEVGDDFGISFSEDFEIATEITDIVEDGIVIDLDDTALDMLTKEGLVFLEGELVEGVAGPQKCWKGYRKVGTKPGTGRNAGKRVNDCEKIGEGKYPFAGAKVGQKEGPEGQLKGKDPKGYPKGKLVGGSESFDHDIDEAEYRGKKVPLGKKLPGDVKKSKVYVRKPNGKVVKVNFGDKKMRIKKSNPARRKSFRARHNCKNPGPRWKARYWSCRSW